MFYRILFNPRKAVWHIQISTFGFMWKSVQAQPTTEPLLEPRVFASYELALDYADAMGLPLVYRPFMGWAHWLADGMTPNSLDADWLLPNGLVRLKAEEDCN